MLANQRRRYALQTLAKCEATVQIEELVERTAKREFERPSAEELRALRIALVHNHLPRLEEAGIVTYDATNGIVRLLPRADTLVSALGRSTDGDSTLPVQELSDTRFSA